MMPKQYQLVQSRAGCLTGFGDRSHRGAAVKRIRTARLGTRGGLAQLPDPRPDPFRLGTTLAAQRVP